MCFIAFTMSRFQTALMDEEYLKKSTNGLISNIKQGKFNRRCRAQRACDRTTRKQGDSDGRNRRKFVGIDRFRRISDEPVRRYRFVGKKNRRNFVSTSDDFLTNTEKRHSDELPTILRCGHTRPEFIGKTTYRRRTFLGQFRRSVFLGVFRRTLVVGIYRRTMVVGIYRRTYGYIFYRNVVEKSSENSDDPCFVGILSKMADGIPTT
ncbi:hypothetical protein F2Q69_00007615 [Brassica cretica]|uniref:Uncharacterized protein n=1 Tax=Brassica cretica TaxID=69181 RepID=A0A8S9NYN9_BRACR|nr:hypothetical protein F2Q69_00007615 [Brassica cretica]